MTDDKTMHADNHKMNDAILTELRVGPALPGWRPKSPQDP